MTPRERTARRLEVETLRQEAIDLDRRFPDLYGFVLVGDRPDPELTDCPSFIFHDSTRNHRPIRVFSAELLPVSSGQFTLDLEQIMNRSSLSDVHYVFAGTEEAYERYSGIARSILAIGLDLAGTKADDRAFIMTIHPQAHLLHRLMVIAGGRHDGLRTLRVLIEPLSDPKFRPVDAERARSLVIPGVHWKPHHGFSFRQTLVPGLFAALKVILGGALAELDDATPEATVGPISPPKEDSRSGPASPNRRATQHDQVVRLPRIERFRAKAFALDEKYPTLRGAIIVGRIVAGSGIPSPLHGLAQLPPPPGKRYPWRAFSPRLAGPPGWPDARNDSILGPLREDDFGVMFAGDGDGHVAFGELARQVADLDLDLAGVGRFGPLADDRLLEAADRLLVFLAAFARNPPERSAIRATLDPFDEVGWEPVPEGRTAILDPEGKAGGSAFAVTIRQGLFDALGEMLAVVLAGATPEAEAPPAVAGPTEATARPKAASINPGTRAIAAAYELSRSGSLVSLKSACKRAGVDRKHMAKRYPEAATAIRKIATPDRSLIRGGIDRRTGNVDGVDRDDD